MSALPASTTLLRRAVAIATATSLSTLGIHAVSAQEPETAETSETAALTFSVQNITDFHGHFSATDSDPGAAALKCLIDQEAAGKNAILTSSGDNIGGSPFNSAILDDAPTIDVLNAMGLAVSAVGNHEFDKGYADLRDRVQPDAEFDYLGANVEGSDLAPYSVEEVGGVRVAFVGSVTDDTAQLVSPAGIEGLTFSDPVAATNKTADELIAADQADVVIALFHAGVTGAEQWSENVDAVFAGHTHVDVEPDAQAHPLIVQAGSYGHDLASVDFSFDPATDQLSVVDAELFDAAAIQACATPNQEIATIVAAAEEQAAQEGEAVVATIGTGVKRGTNAGAESGSNRGVESQLNNLLAEATKWSIAQNTNAVPDIGVMNAGGVRTDLAAGEVTYADAFAVQPFGNENAYTTITGADFKDALEQQWKDGADRPVLSLGVSNNVSYTYDVTRKLGDRVTSITIDGAPMDPAKEYVVAGSTFLLEGGDGFEALTRGTVSNTGLIDVDGFIQYLAAHADDLGVRTGQANVNITTASGELAAGKTAGLDLSSLIYSADETATTVTVTAGSQAVTAEIDPTLGEAGYGEAGTAHVDIDIPADATELVITTDAGTEISYPLAAAEENGEEGSGSTAGSSAAAGFGLVAVFGVVAALLSLNLPAVRDFLAGLGIRLPF